MNRVCTIVIFYLFFRRQPLAPSFSDEVCHPQSLRRHQKSSNHLHHH